MEYVRHFKLDSDENTNVIYLFAGKEQRFLSLNPFQFRLKELDELFDLPENWDGYNALPLSKEIFEKATNFITILNGDLIDRIHDIYPNPHGTITIEWVNRKNEKLSLEVGKSSYSFFIKLLDSKPKFYNGQDIIMDIKILTNSLEMLFRKAISKFVL